MSGSFFVPFLFHSGAVPAPFPYLPASWCLFLPVSFPSLRACSSCAPPVPILSFFPCIACLSSPCSVVVFTCPFPVSFNQACFPGAPPPPVFRRCLRMPLYSLFCLTCFPRAARRHLPVFFIWLGSRVCPPSCPSTPLHTSPHLSTPLHPPPSILLHALRDALSTHPEGWAEIMVKSLHCLAPSVPRPSSFSPYIAFLRLFVRRISSFVGTIP